MSNNPIGELDLHLLHEGTHRHLHRVLGAHPDETGTWFALWAPNAARVRVSGDFNSWTGDHDLARVGGSGVWAAHVAGAEHRDVYRYLVHSADGAVLDKVDPVGAATVEPPEVGSVIADLSYEWNDDEWMAGRGARVARDAPVSIYEVHLGSWGRHVSPGRRFPRYDELADPLADYVLAHGFTHVELLPIMEHPYYGSWGYQTTGYFAPTARHGSPRDLMVMIDRLHERGVGVILDWVPSHFPMDDHGLARFDGTHLFEHADPRQGFHPDWTTAIFNFGRPEVRAFLVSSAVCWLERFHADGLRVDAVASMLYLDYSREEGEWIPNQFGGRENLEAIVFLRQLNEAVYGEFPDVATFAEESTAWPMVSRPTDMGGLGFGYKWDMGWMHDALAHLARDPVHRSYHHGELTFRTVYANTENFVLPLSHDEVVHGKGTLLTRMPGDEWQRFANLRLLLAMQWTQPGKKLLFMGGELGAPTEWAHEGLIDWSLQDAPGHGGIRRLVCDLNALYTSERALHAGDAGEFGLHWVLGDDAERSLYAFVRRDPADAARAVLVVWNTTPTVHRDVHLGVPAAGRWVELLNTDAAAYDGTDIGNLGGVTALDEGSHGQPHSISVSVGPLATLILALEPAR